MNVSTVLIIFALSLLHLVLGQDFCQNIHCGSGICISTQNPALPYFCRCPSGSNTILPCPMENPCSRNPCGEGTCEMVPSLLHGYLCRCAGDIISLTSCNVTRNGCHSSPCVNGLCIEGITNFFCHCLSGWTGKLCAEKLASPCSTKPCGPGKCFELNDPVAPYVCLCTNRQFGLSCRSWEYLSSTARVFTPFRTALSTTTTTMMMTSTASRFPQGCDPFDARSCMNGGRCLATMHNSQCLCPAGYTGAFCEMNINECASNPCRHGGICYDLQASYMCFCPDGSFRTQCLPRPMSTSTARILQCPCQNGGICSMFGSQTCVCPMGFTGRLCERATSSSKCNEIQCMNGGICYDNATNASPGPFCSCKNGFTGRFCETEYFRCRTNGRFADRYQCTEGKYFECIHYHEAVGSTSYATLLSRRCPVSLRFNVQADRCDYPQNVKCLDV